MKEQTTGIKQKSAQELLAQLEQTISERTPNLMDASGQFAVLVPLVEGEEGLSILYEVRAKDMRRQPGEVCFPGGRVEPGESHEGCALRETWEELGIPAEDITVIGKLDFLAHRSNFIMYPVLGVVNPEALERLKLNPAEVDEVFLVPVDYLLENPPQEYTYRLQPGAPENFPYELIGIPRDYRWRAGGENVPVYPYEGHAIWGLTGRITRHLLTFLHPEEDEG